MEKIKLFERIKENSETVGDGNIILLGAADGFSAFGDYYSYNDVVFYAIADGTRYEVGSGQYILDGSNKAIVRFPFQSTNGNNKVSFPDGSPKEVFATYPGKYSVFTASGLGQLSGPQHSGIAFWATENILDYDPSVTWDKTNKRLNIDGEANVSGNVTVGGNVVVSGTMDVQGDVTFIDSSNVTIWDKQLELASMSGTAQFGDGNIDDAGIVVKSTDTDKKWVWKNSTDAWTTDENIVTSLNVQAKSGILDAVLLEDEVPSPTTNTLYNDAGQLKFNGSQIGTWNISDGKGGTEEVLQGQYVHVSGLSGIDTFYNSSTNVLEVNPGVLSGYLSNKIATSITFTRWDLYGETGEDLEVTDLKSVGIVGLSGIDTYSNPDNFQIEINAGSLSGWAAYDIDQLYTSGNAVSGWARGYVDNEVDASGNAISGWAAYDIDQLYTSGNAVSGWAAYDIDQLYTSGNAISGWAAYDIDQLYTSGNAVSGWAAYDIDQLYTSGNAVSGWAAYDIDQLYTSGNAVSGWAAYDIDQLYTSGNSVSGWARGYVDNEVDASGNAISGWAAYDIDQLYTSGNAISGWTRGTITQEIDSLIDGAPNTLNTLNELAAAINDEYNFHTLIRNEIGDSGNAISGWAAYDIDQLYTSGNAVSGWAAYDIDQLYTSGNAVSGWSKAYTDANGGAAASGWAEYHIFDLYTSGMAISGWAKAYADAISSAAGMTNWNVSDGAGGSESITEGATVEWVGLSGIDTYYNSTNNELEINAGSLSGWAAYDIDKLYTSGNAVSGWAAYDIDQLYTSGNAVSGWAAYDIDQLYTSGNAVSGWAAYDIDQLYTSGNAVSGWAAYDIDQLYTSGNAISGWAAYDIDQLYTSGNAVSGWAAYDIDQLYTSGNAVSGWAAYDIDQLYTSGNAISGWAAGSFGAGGGTVSAVANGSDDRVATFSSADALNGEANLTFDGIALGLVGTFTVGVDDTGHDVKFHGATAGSYLEWDESEDRLHLVGGAYVNQPVPSTGTATEDATVTLDLSLGNYFNVLLGADVTAVEFTNATIGQRFIVRFVQVIGATDGYDISWSTVRINGSVTAELKWAGDITPTMTGKDDQTHRGHKDVYGFLCTATGLTNLDTKFDGFIIGQDLPD